MGLEIVRRIRGNVHGSIDVTRVEDAVIGHPCFQRLRRIRQLAFLHYVFPGATHTRFEHSLGVMHLAGVAWEKLKINQERLRQSLSRMESFATLERSPPPSGPNHGTLTPTFAVMDELFSSDYLLQAFRLAGLLHDLGHPPFSHSGEAFLPTWSAVIRDNPDIPDWLSSYLRGYSELLVEQGKDPDRVRVRHEVYSYLLVEKVLRETYERYPDLSPAVEARDVVAIMNHMVEPAPSSPLHKHHTWQICRELISGELDIDRMDYLLRDSRECGVVYGLFDEGRILDSLCLYHDETDNRLHVAITLSGLAAFEDYLRARYSMYLQLYFHKTSVSAEAMMIHMRQILGDWTLPAGVDAYAFFDEFNIGGYLLEKAKKQLPESGYQHFSAILRDLLYQRRLWKRVYEVTGQRRGQTEGQGLRIVEKFLSEHKFAWQRVTSAGSLTRFRPRGENERSANTLRVVVKDEMQIPRVRPVEDYCDLVQPNSRGDTSSRISRLYVDPESGDLRPESGTGLKQLVTRALKGQLQ